MMFIVMMNHSSAAHNTAMSLRSLPTLPRTHHTLNSLELNRLFIIEGVGVVCGVRRVVAG